MEEKTESDSERVGGLSIAAFRKRDRSVDRIRGGLHHLCCAALVAGVALLALGPQATADGKKKKTDPLVSESGLKYLIHEPAKKPYAKAPLMIMLHGTGGGFAYFEGWIAACLKKGYVVVTPESSGCGTPTSGNFNNDDQKRWDSVDIPNVISLVKEILNKYNVDRRRVGLLGFSNGAYYATRIGLGAPELFQSVVCIAGGIGGRGWTDQSRSMGVYIIHGTADTSVPVAQGKSLADQLKADGFPNVIYKEFPGRDHETFPEEAEPVLKWLEPQRHAFTPGANATLDWQMPEKGLESVKTEGKKGLLYFFSAKDADSELVLQAELGIFAEPQVIESAKALVCMKADRDNAADLVKQFGVKGPAILLLDAGLKVVEKIDKWCTPAEFAAKLKKVGK